MNRDSSRGGEGGATAPGKKGRLPSVAGWVAAYALVFLPAVLGFLYVRSFGVDIPFGDAWKMVPRFDELALGTLSFKDLWEQHFEHRIFFPRIALLLLGVATNFDQLAAMYATQACLLLTLLVFLAAFGARAWGGLLLFVPVSLLVFNLGQYFNMLNALQLALVFAQTFGVLALYLLHLSGRAGRAGWFAFAAALGSGAVASFSLGSGLLVWPAGFVQLLVSRTEKPKKRLFVLAWSLAGLAAWVAYFRGLRIPKRQRGSFFLDDPDPVGQAEFLLVLLGNPLAWWGRQGLVLAAGFLVACAVVAALVLVYRAGKLGEYAFWIGVLSFFSLCTASIVLARSGGPVELALVSRYITFAGLVTAAAYAMLARLALEGGHRAAAVCVGALFAVVALAAPFSYADASKQGARNAATKVEEVAILSTYSTRLAAELDIANRSPAYVEANAFVLCKLGYSVFSDERARARNCLPPPLADLSPAGTVAPAGIDSVAGVEAGGGGPVVVPGRKVGGGSVMVTGWATEPGGEPAGGVYVEVDGEAFPAFYGRNREDGRGRAIRSVDPTGFELDVPASRIGPGRHELSVVAVSADRKEYYKPGAQLVFKIRGLGERPDR